MSDEKKPGFIKQMFLDHDGKPSNTRLNLTIVVVTIALGIAASVVITAARSPQNLSEVLWPAVSALGLAFGGHAVKAFAGSGKQNEIGV